MMAANVVQAGSILMTIGLRCLRQLHLVDIIEAGYTELGPLAIRLRPT